MMYRLWGQSFLILCGCWGFLCLLRIFLRENYQGYIFKVKKTLKL